MRAVVQRVTEGDVTVENCEVNGWIGIGGGIKVTFKDSEFDNGNWAGGNLYGDDITIDGCNFNNGFKFGIVYCRRRRGVGAGV